MSHQPHPVNSANGGYERRDIGVAGVLYFLLGLAVAGVLVHFLVMGVYSALQKRFESRQTSISPLVTTTPKDTRKLTVDYRDYLKENFPKPQLEIDERSQLDGVRLDEEKTMSTYDWVDQKTGAVRIPIDRAMDLVAQRGLPVHAQETQGSPGSQQQNTKGTKK